MGGGQSTKATVNSQLKNNIVNETTIKNLNKTVMNNATNTLIDIAASCSASTDLTNTCRIRAGKISARGKGSNVSVQAKQDNALKANFSCVNESSAASDMKSSMKETIKNEIKAVSDTDLMNKLTAKAAGSSEQGFGANLPGMKGPKVDSTTNTNIENNVTNRFNQTIENVLEKNFSNNFSSKTVSECIDKKVLKNRADLDADGIEADEGGKVDLSCVQTNSVESVTSCKSLSQAINKSVDGIIKDLGLQTVKEDKVKAKSESDASAEAKNVATGPIQDMGKAVAGVVDSVGNAAGNILGGAALLTLGPSLIAFLLCCCCCVISIGLVFLSKGSGSDVPPTNLTEEMPSETIQTLTETEMPSQMIQTEMPSQTIQTTV